VIHKPVNGCFV